MFTPCGSLVLVLVLMLALAIADGAMWMLWANLTEYIPPVAAA